MTNSKNTKRALLMSVLSIVLCAAMLVGSTFAWFTDSAQSGENHIMAGNLDLSLEMKDESGEWIDAEGETLEWLAADGRAQDDILWEPGCTYKLPDVRITNNGNLALKFKVIINGVDGDSKLLEAITFTYEGLDVTAEGHLLPEESSEAITITGHMEEWAGNEYQSHDMKGIGITVIATQDTVESDSFDNQYDKNAMYLNPIMDEQDLIDVFEQTGGNAILNSDVAWDASPLYIRRPTSLDLNGCSISANYLNVNWNAGEVEIKNGTIQQLYKEPVGDDWTFPSAFMVWNGNTVTLKDTTINSVNYGGLNENAIHVEDESEYFPEENLGKSVLILESGTVINGNISVQGEQAELYIKEGATVKFQENAQGLAVFNNAKVVITGGLFNKSVEQYVAEGYEQVEEL